MGFAIVLYANAALQGAILGMQNAHARIKGAWRLDESSARARKFTERQRLVRKPLCNEMERKYAREDKGK